MIYVSMLFLFWVNNQNCGTNNAAGKAGKKRDDEWHTEAQQTCLQEDTTRVHGDYRLALLELGLAAAANDRSYLQ